MHTDAAMSCLSIETTGVSSEDLLFLAPKSRSASDLKPEIFHGFARVNHGFSLAQVNHGFEKIGFFINKTGVFQGNHGLARVNHGFSTGKSRVLPHT